MASYVPRRLLLAGLAVVVFLAAFWSLLPESSIPAKATEEWWHPINDSTNTSHSLHNQPVPELPLRKRHNVAVASTFVHHFDVYMALVWTLELVLQPKYDGENSDGPIHVFAPPFGFGFQSVVDRLQLYHGVRGLPEALVPHIVGQPGDGGIDMVVLGTCEIDLPHWHAELLAAWDARDDTHKFKLVCIVHNVKDTSWQRLIPEWSSRSALRLLPIADHVAKSFRKDFSNKADSIDPAVYTTGYEHIPVDVHVPLLDIPDLPTKPANRALSKAIIQGTFQSDAVIITASSATLSPPYMDPQAWGYQALEGGSSFVPNHRATDAPFELLLVGAGSLDIPEELAYLVSIHRDLDYEDFYALIAGADVVVPAFADFGYFEDQASSTVHLAMELDMPLLVTQRTREAYGYIDDDRAVITRPAAMHEVHALRALRTGNASAFLNSDPTGTGHPMSTSPLLAEAVRSMIEEGWYATKKSFYAFKKDVWQSNRDVVERLLRDL
ncbi:hypothetical protein A0H81_08138 [Grifola frondosa]|uniref:Uncharacterized protein n=1 Tax=Grifola frondosa TaxID=5627 RepID=A0A1C7M6H7_GRIFR|nr:hypothetical protein A0H81_08138 [Grifola frondosa]